MLVGLAAGAGAFIWFEGDLRTAPIREARIFYDQGLVETFTSCISRGKEATDIPIAADPTAPLPLPVVPSSEALLAPQMMLALGDKPCLRPARDRLLVHTLGGARGSPFSIAQAHPGAMTWRR